MGTGKSDLLRYNFTGILKIETALSWDHHPLGCLSLAVGEWGKKQTGSASITTHVYFTAASAKTASVERQPPRRPIPNRQASWRWTKTPPCGVIGEEGSPPGLGIGGAANSDAESEIQCSGKPVVGFRTKGARQRGFPGRPPLKTSEAPVKYGTDLPAKDSSK